MKVVGIEATQKIHPVTKQLAWLVFKRLENGKTKRSGWRPLESTIWVDFDIKSLTSMYLGDTAEFLRKFKKFGELRSKDSSLCPNWDLL